MKLSPSAINSLSREIHEQNVEAGWWDNPDRCYFECLQLASTEVAEATEGARKVLMDDHLPHRVMEEVELADTVVRLLDLGGKMSLDYIEQEYFDLDPLGVISETDSVGKLHLTINCTIVALAILIADDADKEELNGMYSLSIDAVLRVAELRGFDLWTALFEKVEYNKTRADHKRENRAKDGGKKF